MTQVFLCSGDTTRTCDLRVMSPTSYQLLHPAIYLLLPISIYSRTCVRQLTDMSPTSYSRYFGTPPRNISFIAYFNSFSNVRPSADGNEPDER